MILVRLVLEIQDTNLKERLLRASDLSLEKTIENCKVVKLVKMQQRFVQLEVQMHHVASKKNSRT